MSAVVVLSAGILITDLQYPPAHAATVCAELPVLLWQGPMTAAAPDLQGGCLTDYSTPATAGLASIRLALPRDGEPGIS